jgi:hypothetical protein
VSDRGRPQCASRRGLIFTAQRSTFSSFCEARWLSTAEFSCAAVEARRTRRKAQLSLRMRKRVSRAPTSTILQFAHAPGVLQ